MIIDRKEKIIIIDAEDLERTNEWTDIKVAKLNPIGFLTHLEQETSLEEIQRAKLIFFRNITKRKIYIIKNSYGTEDDPKLKEKYLYYNFQPIENRFDILDL